MSPSPPHGRGSTQAPDSRFLSWQRQPEDDGWPQDASPPPKTTLSVDRSRTVISRNESPDVPFDRSINPYRGCEHGCAYCFARPTHAWLGLSPGLDFETRLSYKPDAADQLARELAHPGYVCAPIALGVNTDAYQPVERQLGITRGILKVLSDCRHPVVIVTKGALIERDIDLLEALAKDRLVQVMVSVTTLEADVARRLEPRATAPHRRLAMIAALAAARIPVGVLVAPVIPALTDHEMEDILSAAADHGASTAGYVLLRLPLEVRPLFTDWLAHHAPDRAAHVMSLLRQMRGGRENDPRFGHRMKGVGPVAELYRQRFALACRTLGLAPRHTALETALFRPPPPTDGQMRLF